MQFDSSVFRGGPSGITSRTSRKTGLATAPPLSDQLKQSIAFLFKIKSILVVTTLKNADGDSSLVLDVCIQEDTSKAAKGAVISLAAAGEQLNTENAAATITILQIQRTFKEFKELEKAVVHWSGKHVYLDPKFYGVDECSYCAHFYARKTAWLWPATLTKLTTSKHNLEKQLEVCINDYVFHARLPRPSDLECKGFDHIPSIVARFLLQDTPLPDSPLEAKNVTDS